MKRNGRKIQKVRGESRSNSVCIQQHQHQHVTAMLRNSDDAREDAVQLAGLGGAVEEAHQPVPEEQQKKGRHVRQSERAAEERHTSTSLRRASEERENKCLALVHILQEKKGVCAACIRQQRQKKKRGLRGAADERGGVRAARTRQQTQEKGGPCCRQKRGVRRSVLPVLDSNDNRRKKGGLCCR